MAGLYCGTSGFSYPSWKPGFYPEKLPSKKFLEHYSTRLNAVEINYSFRRLLPESIVENWIRDTPEGFLFAPKAHQKLTHFQRLKRSEFTREFFDSLNILEQRNRLGPVLFQTPPNLSCDLPRLEEFLLDFPEGVRCAFEFRNPSWFVDPVYELLESRGIALCLAESEKLVAPERITADFVYFRLRKGEYSKEERQLITEKIRQFREDGKDVFVFFKHEDDPAGALYAEEILNSQ